MDSLVDFGITSRLKDFKNYGRFSTSEKGTIVALALLFNPTLIDDKLIFRVPKNSELLQGSSNKIYAITNAQHIVAVTDSVVIGEKSVSVTSVMFYSAEWITDHFINPFQAEAWRVQDSFAPSKTVTQVQVISQTPSYTRESEGATHSPWPYACCALFYLVATMVGIPLLLFDFVTAGLPLIIYGSICCIICSLSACYAELGYE